MKPHSLFVAFLALLVVGLAACEPASEAPTEEATLVIYSGRGKSLVDPLVEKFEAATGIEVQVRYAGTAELAVALTEEGAQSSADLFWAQDGGALGAVHAAGLLTPLPDSLLSQVPSVYRSASGTWVATSARARTLAYAPARVDTTALPTSIFDLTDATYANRVGWAPGNGSFQAFVTAMRNLEGDERTRAWLIAMRDNGAKAYTSNSAIVQAIADGEVDFGLPNHYYLLRFTSEDADFPVAQTFFAEGDPGNLVNIAGGGILASAAHPNAARRFLAYLLSDEAQTYFAEDTFEYPVIGGIDAAMSLPPLDQLQQLQPRIDLDNLSDLEATLEMLRETELL